MFYLFVNKFNVPKPGQGEEAVIDGECDARDQFYKTVAMSLFICYNLTGGKANFM